MFLTAPGGSRAADKRSEPVLELALKSVKKKFPPLQLIQPRIK
jgi:hypothetical protein